MFLKRLSSALCALTCVCGFVLGTNANTLPDAKQVREESTLMAPLALSAVPKIFNISCYGEGDGRIEVSVNDWFTSIYWELRDLSGNMIPGKSGTATTNIFNINNIDAGSYRIFIRDGLPAEWLSSTQVITEPKRIVVDLIDITPIQCNGGSGAMSFLATGDVGGFTYSALNTTTSQPFSSSSGTFNNLPAGNYNVVAVDSNNCEESYTGAEPLKLVEPALLNPTVVPTQIACFGETGSAKITGLPENSGINIYNISLENTSTGSTSYSLVNQNTYIGLDAGVYTLTVWRDGCTPVTRNFTMDTVSDIVINETINGSIDCFGDKVSVEVTANGGKAGKYVSITLDNNDGDTINDQTSPWTLYGTSHTFTLVGEGSYTIRVVDQETPSCLKTKSITISGPSSPLVYLSSPVGVSTRCNGTADGTIQFSVDGGQTPYTYYVESTPYTDPATILLAAGTYNVYVEDANGCTTNVESVTIGQPNPLTASLDVTSVVNVTCPGGNNGSVAITVTGGNGTYLYDLTGPITLTNQNAEANFTIGSLKAGAYTANIKDQKGCEAVNLLYFDIGEPNAISINTFDFSKTVLCDGETTDLSVSASGGSQSNMTYQLFKGSTYHDEKSGTGTVTFSNLLPSVYSLRIWSDTGCPSKDTIFTIEAPTQLVINNYPDTIKVNCAGETASLALSVKGLAPFSYELNGDGNIIPFTSGGNTTIPTLAAAVSGQTHVITIYDANSCSKNIDVTVFEPLGLTNSMPVVTDVTCRGSNSGKVEVNITGGTAGYSATMGSLTQSSSTGNVVFNNVPAGNYTLQVTDSKGCTLDAPVPVDVEQPAETFAIEVPVIVDPILCFGDKANVAITVLGGWNVSKEVTVQGMGVNQTQPSGSIFNLLAGSYTITASNSDGCNAAPYYLDVTQPPRLVLSLTGSTNVSCAGADDASIAFSVAGGTPGYLYGLDGAGSASNTFAGNSHTITGGLESGTYQLFVRDDNGCPSNIVPVTITEPTPVVFTVERVDSVECHGANNGRIVIAAQGGSGSFQYALGGNITRPLQASREFGSLTAGTYTVRVQDSRNCSAIDNDRVVVVEQPNNPVEISNVLISQQVSCNGRNDAAITISAIGGEPYVGLHYRVSRKINPDPENNEISGLGAGLYDVYVSDSRGKCEKKWPSQINVINPTPVTLLQTEKKDVSCHNSEDGSVRIAASGGRQPYTFYLYENNTPVGDGQLNGNFFDLGGISTNPNVSSARSYTVVVNDSSLCEQRHTFSITNPATLRINEQAHRQVSCNDLKDGWIRVNVVGGTGNYSFKKDYADAAVTTNITAVSNSVYTLNSFDGGNFRPMVMDANGCTDTITNHVFIFNPPKLIIDNVIAGIKLCENSTNDSTTIILDADNRGTQGNYRYSIDNGVTFQTDSLFINARQRTIQPLVVDSMGCTASYAEQAIIWPDRFDVIVSKNEIRCWDRQYGTLTLDINGGTGPYYFSVEDPLFADNPKIIEKDNSRPTTIDTVGNLPNNLFLYGVPYEVYIKDHNNCAAQNIGHPVTTTPVGTFTWQYADTLTLVNIDPTSPKCAGRHGTINYTVTGGTEPYEYWVQSQQASGTVVPTNPDDDGLVNVPTGMTLYAYVTDYYKCKAFVPDNQPYDFLTTIIHPANDTVKVEWEVLKQPYCPSTKDGRLGLEVTGFLKEGVTFNILKRDLSYSENWNLIFTDQILRDEATDSIPKPLPPGVEEVDANEKLYSISDYRVNYKFTIGEYNIEFYDNITGCEVDYFFEMIPDTSECEDVFPKIFTPNNDGQNDLWMVSQYEKSNVSLKIFSAYGELVYEFSGLVPEEGLTWNGFDSFRKRPVPAGTYMYIYNPDVSEDKSGLEKGTITLLRNR